MQRLEKQLFLMVTYLGILVFLGLPVKAQQATNQIYLPLIFKSNSNQLLPPTIGLISSNLADYGGQVPRYKKLELTFDIISVANNMQWPYDPAPPAGLQPGTGITVNALFSQDNWQIVYSQPAFYFQDFQEEVKGGKEWLYPSGNFTWKVRFAPHQTGEWQVKVVAQDAGGLTESKPFTFTVVESAYKGFIRASSNDTRYFEYDEGSYFPGLGYNMNYRAVDWVNPVLSNQTKFQKMSENKIQRARIWLSQWAIFGSAWNMWRSHVDNYYIPTPALSFTEIHTDSDLSLKVAADWNRCVLTNWETAAPAVKRNTDYRIRVRYKTTGIPASPTLIDPSNPSYGFVIKTGGWLWGNSEQEKCSYPGVGTVVSNYVDENTSDWQILEGTINTGNSDFLPRIYLTMANLTQGTTYVDHVWVQEDLGNGQYGPNVIYKPDMDHHRYMDQRNSYAFDKVLALAEANDVYLRLVVHEKNDWIMNRIDYDGNFSLNQSNDYFYGNQRNISLT
jgi:hypothetical protein